MPNREIPTTPWSLWVNGKKRNDYYKLVGVLKALYSEVLVPDIENSELLHNGRVIAKGPELNELMAWITWGAS